MKAEGGKREPTPNPPNSSIPPSAFRPPPFLLDWLSTPQAYPDQSRSIERRETHISIVFMTDRFAYKLKKPVRFDFLDFSTLKLRRAACEEEIRLNRRLAPEVYVGVVAVRQKSDGQFWLDESESSSDQIVEWLVKMHRLPDQAMLRSMIESGRATDDIADAIAARLEEFYRQAPPLPIEPQQYILEIERHVRANRTELLKPEHGLNSAIKRTHGAQLRLLALRSDLFEARAEAGCVIDGHGDLRPEHIYLLPHPVVIDCIEFNAEFRRLDRADELSFLATECDFAGAEPIGRRIFEQTMAALCDQPPSELVAFYRSYRACVRAKVAALRSRQLQGEERNRALAEAARHLQWADRYDRQLPLPLVIVISGLMGSGKSTLAQKLSELLGAEVIASDAVRRKIFGESSQPAGYGEGNYNAQRRDQVYREMFAQAERLLDDGLTVVLDATFLKRDLRTAAIEIPGRRKLPGVVAHCHCPVEIVLQRIASRAAAGHSQSEARPELFERQKAEEDPYRPARDSIEIDTTQPAAAQLAKMLSAISTLS